MYTIVTVHFLAKLVHHPIIILQFCLLIFLIVLLPKPQGSCYAYVCEVALSEIYSVPNYEKLLVRCTSVASSNKLDQIFV